MLLPEFGCQKIYIEEKEELDKIVFGMATNQLYTMDLKSNQGKSSQDSKRSKSSDNNNDENSKNNNDLNRCLYCSSFEQKSIKQIVAKSIPDQHPSAPILPPDMIPFLGISQVMTSVSEAKNWYNMLRHNKTKRCYVFGSYYKKMFDHHLSDIIDWKKTGDIDITVLCNNNKFTTISVRSAPLELSNSILKLHKRLKKVSPNCRGEKTGDTGQMYSLGKRDEQRQYVTSARNRDIRVMMRQIGLERKQWFEKEYPDEYNKHFSTPNTLQYLRNTLSDFMVHSVELCNSAHYDVNDETITTATWIEETIGNTANWFFIFPNVTRDMKKAIVIQLFHGCTVTWDANELKHCSSKVEYRIRGGGGGTSAGNCELRRRKKK